MHLFPLSLFLSHAEIKESDAALINHLPGTNVPGIFVPSQIVDLQGGRELIF
jgi:hypothetical protein